VGPDEDPLATTTNVVVAAGRYRIEGSPEQVEAAIIAASRGSIMQLAWLAEAGTGRAIGVNPIHVVALEAVEP
jgi:hypothetical protein